MAGHTAFNSVSIIEKLPLKIECMDIWDERLIVGTTEGTLLVYEVKEKPTEARAPFLVTLIDSHKFFSRKPIRYLLVVEELRLLLSISDYVHVHALGSFKHHSTLSKSKNCEILSIDKSPSAIRLCLAAKRKLVLFEWDGKQFSEIKELAVPEPARAVEWCGESLCVGFRKEYNTIDIRTGTMREIFPTGRSGTPLITQLPKHQILLLRDNISIFLGHDGKPTRKFGLSWSEIPLAISYYFPYVLAVLPKFVEVRSVSGTQTLVQTIALRGARTMQVKRDIYVASQTTVWRLVPVPLLAQVDQLVKEHEYEDALNLVESLTDFPEAVKASKLKEIKELYASTLFNDGQHARAMEFFFELETDPVYVIGLYPNLLPKNIANTYEYPGNTSVLVGSVLEQALAALINYLTQIRPSIMSGTYGSSTGSSPDETSASASTSTSTATPSTSASGSGSGSGSGSTSMGASGSLMGSQLVRSPVAGPASASVLASEADYGAVTDLATIVDTALLKAYIKTKNPDIRTLLSLPNCCHVAECEKALLNFTKYHELVLLYKGKGLHAKALDLLSKLGVSHEVEAPDLHGTAALISYLKDLGPEHLKLIIEFSKWPLQATPREALAIFMEREGERMALPADIVLAHLKSINPSLVTPYLEYVILKQGEKSPAFHNELILNYVDTIMNLRKDPSFRSPQGGYVSAGTEPGLLGLARRKLLRFLEESTCYSPEKMLGKFINFDDLYEERALIFSRNNNHLRALSIYVHILNNFQMAEQYCNKHYNVESDARDVYLALLQVCLRELPAGVKPLLDRAMYILNKYYKQIDAPKALDLLPINSPIQQLAPFFKNVILERTNSCNDTQIRKNLLKLENIQVHEKLIYARSHMVKITENRECPVCHKRLGKHVFARYPNGVVVDYKCCRDPQVCPVTGTQFSRSETQIETESNVGKIV
jgi:hypothetical protein